MKYTFLHISDLHYRSNWHEENGLVCKSFIEDIKSQLKNYDNTYLVFSGDIVFEGAEEALYTEFESKFTRQLGELGLTKNRRICVPGNHDVSRNALKPFLTIQKGTLNEISSEQSFNDNLPQNIQSFFDSKFNNYKTYETKFAQYNACEKNLGGSGWELSNDIGVYCLNTALCS